MAENVFEAFGTKPARGILTPGDGPTRRLVLTRHEPTPDLAAIVERCWVVRWDLRGQRSLEQEVLPFPCVNVVFGDHRPGVHGPVTRRFVAHLSGQGSVIGIKFRPSGFHALCPPGVTPKDLVDRALPFAGAWAELERGLCATSDDKTRVELALSFLRAHHPGPDDEDRAVDDIVEASRTNPEVSRVAQLAEVAGRSVRALERLFRARIGVSPKWVIRRFRVQEAALRLASGAPVDLAALAQTLGYFDQSHFTHDFRSQVGRSPSQYIAYCVSRRRNRMDQSSPSASP